MQPYLLGNTLLILMYSVYVLQDSGFQLSIVKPNQTNYRSFSVIRRTRL